MWKSFFLELMKTQLKKSPASVRYSYKTILHLDYLVEGDYGHKQLFKQMSEQAKIINKSFRPASASYLLFCVVQQSSTEQMTAPRVS